jgi:hypothetical protein
MWRWRFMQVATTAPSLVPVFTKYNANWPAHSLYQRSTPPGDSSMSPLLAVGYRCSPARMMNLGLKMSTQAGCAAWVKHRPGIR